MQILWPGPISLAATFGVSVDVLSSSYLDVSVRWVRLTCLFIQHVIPLMWWVAPFGDPRIKGFSHLPVAFRSVTRPSSPLGGKAFTKCPYLLDTFYIHSYIYSHSVTPSRPRITGLSVSPPTLKLAAQLPQSSQSTIRPISSLFGRFGQLACSLFFTLSFNYRCSTPSPQTTQYLFSFFLKKFKLNCFSP